MKEAAYKIAETIVKVAIDVDKILYKIANEGIFFMPELAFAYAVGKAVMEKKTDIFCGRKITWCREESLGNGGPTDLIFKYEEGEKGCIAIEFKLRDTDESYGKDLDKLSNLDSNVPTTRIFCALIDVYEDFERRKKDARLILMENYDKAHLVPLTKQRIEFKTTQSRHGSDISCVVGVWVVGDIPSLT